MHLIFYIIIYHLNKQIRDLRVKLTTPAAFNLRTHLLLWPDIGIRSVGGHRIIVVCYRYDPRLLGYIHSGQPIRVSPSVKPFMMPSGACSQQITVKKHDESSHLFPAPKNESGVISNRAVYKYYVRICRSLGIKISKEKRKGPHSFRRNGITKVTNNSGGDLMLASLIYGNSPQTAKKYSYTGYDLEKAKAALEK